MSGSLWSSPKNAGCEKAHAWVRPQERQLRATVIKGRSHGGKARVRYNREFSSTGKWPSRSGGPHPHHFPDSPRRLVHGSWSSLSQASGQEFPSVLKTVCDTSIRRQHSFLRFCPAVWPPALSLQNHSCHCCELASYHGHSFRSCLHLVVLINSGYYITTCFSNWATHSPSSVHGGCRQGFCDAAFWSIKSIARAGRTKGLTRTPSCSNMEEKARAGEGRCAPRKTAQSHEFHPGRGRGRACSQDGLSSCPQVAPGHGGAEYPSD